MISSDKLNRMRILLITRYFPPLEGVATNRMVSWAKYWSRSGHDVTVCTTDKGERGKVDFPAQIIEIPYFDPIASFGGDRVKKQASMPGGVRSYLSHLAMSWYRRRLNERMPGRTAFWPRQAKMKLMREPGFDLAVSSYGPPASHQIGLWAQKYFRCLWFADFRDLWILNHNYLGIWPFTLWERRLERQVIRRADCTITVSEGLRNVLFKQYPNSDIRLIPNGFDPDDFQERTRQKRNTKFTITYTGTLYDGKQDPIPLFEALAKLRNRDYSFASRVEVLFLGNASKRLTELIKRFGLDDIVHYQGVVSHEQALQAQADADALLLLNFDHAYDGILTGKVYEYLAAKKPVLALGVSPESELGRLIVKVGGGVLCPNKAEMIAQTTIALERGDISHQSDPKALELYSRKHQAELITSWALKCSQRTISSSE